MGNKERNEVNNVVSSLNRESFSFTSFICQMSPLSRKSRSKIAIFRDGAMWSVECGVSEIQHTSVVICSKVTHYCGTPKSQPQKVKKVKKKPH